MIQELYKNKVETRSRLRMLYLSIVGRHRVDAIRRLPHFGALGFIFYTSRWVLIPLDAPQW